MTPPGGSKAAVVTGGAAGIGLGITTHLLDQGWSVVAADRDAEACARLASERPAAELRAVTADVATEDGARAAIDACVDAFGGVSLLCNNAGVQTIAPLADISLELWRETFQINVDAALLCTRAALPHMRAAGGGSVVNIASISGQVPYVEGGAYASSKAALIMLSRVQAIELGPDGVRVNCICPGAINRDPANPTIPSGHIPIGRSGLPSDVAPLVAYLGSDEAAYMSGAVITLDGGATAGRQRVRR